MAHIWSTKFPWAKVVIDANGEVHQVQCVVCSRVEGRVKLPVNELDHLCMYAGRRKAISTMTEGLSISNMVIGK